MSYFDKISKMILDFLASISPRHVSYVIVVVLILFGLGFIGKVIDKVRKPEKKEKNVGKTPSVVRDMVVSAIMDPKQYLTFSQAIKGGVYGLVHFSMVSGVFIMGNKEKITAFLGETSRIELNKKVSQGPYEICLKEINISSKRATYVQVRIKNIGTDDIKLLAGVTVKKALRKWIQFEVNNKSINPEYVFPTEPFQYGVLPPGDEVEVEFLFPIVPKSLIEKIRKINFSLFLKQSPKGEVTKLTVDTNVTPIPIEPSEFLLNRFHSRYIYDFLSYGGFILVGLCILSLVSLLIPFYPLIYVLLAIITVPIIKWCINLNIKLLALTEQLKARELQIEKVKEQS
ncbi:hypothetical protein [Brevibacillus borstelensis]|uniref:hypothetical protein n=1 Tax=Brevibacillus borstelensis TaxID=45462 RepID=UPI00046AA75C|nr:hypothetical protein [Brevibacillus borstelensis]MCC0567094.1 hypothetical protein [Brevibacillus borstelensis]MCM3473506.1 hypothetical protein [Brevibacillus borstelensis]MCM3561454.1 hypothetical protein [Brevibacillus borstelensis]MCM3594002.1 hypothetical protein [Brevibacillus borstelensis]MED1855130.1 hypothetical protein [Brevibacillus borstelensis]